MARQAQHGDVIKVAHTWYSHYGIYVDGGTVIHYTDENSGDFKGWVSETPLRQFLNGEKYYTVCEFNPKDYPKIFSPDETVRRARSKIGEGGYNFFTHNCEHFAVWCKTGKYESSQVDGFSITKFLDALLPF